MSSVRLSSYSRSWLHLQPDSPALPPSHSRGLHRELKPSKTSWTSFWELLEVLYGCFQSRDSSLDLVVPITTINFNWVFKDFLLTWRLPNSEKPFSWSSTFTCSACRCWSPGSEPGTIRESVQWYLEVRCWASIIFVWCCHLSWRFCCCFCCLRVVLKFQTFSLYLWYYFLSGLWVRVLALQQSSEMRGSWREKDCGFWSFLNPRRGPRLCSP